ncbi:MAG: alanine racemase [Bacteroidetes bacterium]|nr:alanine racemase [Bacteroidota bacterium]
MKILRPTLLLDRKKCLRNIQRMADKARHHHLHFRPHFKTHQSAVIGSWFRDYGVDAITVTSCQMANYFADHGWNDITIAMPVNLMEINDIDRLAGQINLNLLVESEETVTYLTKHLRSMTGVFIEIDTGHHRTGVEAKNISLIRKMTGQILNSRQLTFKGLLTHSGQSYLAKDKHEIQQIHYDTISKMVGLKDNLLSLTHDITLSIGDTPCCSIMENFEGIDEIRPGNFVFYDVMQYKLGSCMLEDIAVAMACPVIARYPLRNELVIYGGAVHFSKDFIVMESGEACFGLLVNIKDNHWENNDQSYLSTISQEHGIIKLIGEDIKSYRTGDIIGILPVHSCLTGAAMRSYTTLDGENIHTLLSGK